jgi:hypothetical protein
MLADDMSFGRVQRHDMTPTFPTQLIGEGKWRMEKLDIKKGWNMITLDPGSGQGFPSILMGQFYQDKCLGLHIGIKLDPGLMASSGFNAKLVATKALVNVQ